MSNQHEIAFVKFDCEDGVVYVRAEFIVGITRAYNHLHGKPSVEFDVRMSEGDTVYVVSEKSLETMSLVVLTQNEAVVIASETTDYMGIEFRGVKNPEEFRKGLDEALTGEGGEK